MAQSTERRGANPSDSIFSRMLSAKRKSRFDFHKQQQGQEDSTKRIFNIDSTGDLEDTSCSLLSASEVRVHVFGFGCNGEDSVFA